MEPDPYSQDRSLSRRTLIGGGCAALAALALLPSRRGASAAPGSAELFVFKPPEYENAVIAVVRTDGNAWSGGTRVLIHAGDASWTVSPPQNRVASHRAPARRFFGRDAIVVEVPPGLLLSQVQLRVWAQIFDTGTIHRAGNPVVAALVARDAPFARLYHAGSPADDVARLTEPFAQHVARAASGSMDDPLGYGRRVAARFLPDVLEYSPAVPAGFTFALQNGRLPADDAPAVAAAIAYGVGGAAAVKAPQGRWTLPSPSRSLTAV